MGLSWRNRTSCPYPRLWFFQSVGDTVIAALHQNKLKQSFYTGIHSKQRKKKEKKKPMTNEDRTRSAPLQPPGPACKPNSGDATPQRLWSNRREFAQYTRTRHRSSPSLWTSATGGAVSRVRTAGEEGGVSLSSATAHCEKSSGGSCSAALDATSEDQMATLLMLTVIVSALHREAVVMMVGSIDSGDAMAMSLFSCTETHDWLTGTFLDLSLGAYRRPLRPGGDVVSWKPLN